ncbi:MAG TPA: CoA-binding protein [Vicinamibacterales bacterium]|nr:CoA-binding protein [Vicinamibacterales bacterium]
MKRRNSPEAINQFVALPALALVGLSQSGRKFGNLACRELRAKGYRVYPIHPLAGTIEGVRCYRTFADLPERVDALLVVVTPESAIDAVRDAAAAGIHHVWLQQGAESPELLSLCDSLGLTVVSGECILMFTRPKGVHNVHRWLRSVFGRLPRTPPAPDMHAS